MSTTPVRPPDQPYSAARRGLSGGRIAMIVIGSVLALIGLGLLAGGVAVAAASHSRDSAGFVTAGPAQVDSDAYAVAVPGIGVDVRGPDEAYARDLLGSVRIRATSDDPSQAVFVGLAPTRDVDAYLDGNSRSCRRSS